MFCCQALVHILMVLFVQFRRLYKAASMGGAGESAQTSAEVWFKIKEMMGFSLGLLSAEDIYYICSVKQ